MNNFTFQNPTKLIFGKNTEQQVGEEVKKYSGRVLVHYGSDRIKKTGLFERVTKSLKDAGIEYLELGGVEPNPRLKLVYEGIKICKENKIDFILAVGGGSTIDSAKGIAAGALYDGDVWDFYDRKKTVEKAIGVGTVLTIPAAGSESSPNSVVSNMEKNLKRGIGSPALYPKFSILNPELTYTLPDYQTACGAADMMAHIFERYMTNTEHVELTDRLSEAALRTIINNVPVAIKDHENYDARAEVMWAGCFAHNGLLGMGREEDWGTHMIEHEVSAVYDIAHGAGLAICFPAWMKYVYKTNINRFVQFATRVWGVENDVNDPEKTALAGIARLEEFWQSIGLPIRLKDVDIDSSRFEEMAKKCTLDDSAQVGNFVKLKAADIVKIYELAL